jgi:LPXTG-site transpeptidase (sortase) family protein
MGKFISFLLTFGVLFGVTVLFLAAVDSLPNPPGTTSQHSTDTSAASSTVPQGQGEQPVQVTVADIKLNVSIANPASTDIDVLDEALLRGAVRYPTSALLGEQGTVLLFGHSSYLPVVRNQAFKAFDDIQKLKPGQSISVYSATREYRYSVTGVRQVNVEAGAIVELPEDGQYLTLVTCDSFKGKADRFVVTAKLEGVYDLVSDQ